MVKKTTWTKKKTTRKTTKKTPEKNVTVIVPPKPEDFWPIESQEDIDYNTKYQQLKQLVQRWVTNKSLIAKTLWIDRTTVYVWIRRLWQEYSEVVDSTDKKKEFWKMIDQIDVIFYSIWKEIQSWNMSEERKISALVNAMQPLRFKAELMWLNRSADALLAAAQTNNFYQINNSVYTYYASLLWWKPEDIEKLLSEWKDLPNWMSIEEITWIKPI